MLIKISNLPCGTVSDRFRIVSDHLNDFWIVSDRFWIVSDHFWTNLFLIFQFQISIGQGWGTAVADCRSNHPGQRSFRGRPQPWPIRHPTFREVCGVWDKFFENPKGLKQSMLILKFYQQSPGLRILHLAAVRCVSLRFVSFCWSLFFRSSF